MLLDHDKIDLVAHDPKSGRVILSIVEVRPWGERGELLPDFQAKLNTYLGYALEGQLATDYPAMREKKITILLQTKYPITQREEHFVEIVKRNILEPRDILLSVQPLGANE